MKFILIAGIPGTGKTTIGNYLEKKHGFIHFDIEKINQIPMDQIVGARRLGKDIVITWGFIPGDHDPIIQKLIELGARMIWFDGNRKAARKAFLKRGTVSEEFLDLQMDRITKSNLIEKFKPVVFDTFKPGKDNFLGKNFIVNQLLNLADTEVQ
jgi:hypothetical protein